ncbi:MULTISPECIES: hypothetical protein [unclassified Sphingobacterium]|uniref:hypothetical protein n=1 Tax=unclassified Sphingobacterium TaxID=2609468 RepID=UPI0025E8CF3E|nr:MULTISPECIES: hypothetical protein [unclassified Sphingobacterium]
MLNRVVITSLLLNTIFATSAFAQHKKVVLDRAYSFIISDGEIGRILIKDSLLLKLHGSLFEFKQPLDLNAKDWEVEKTNRIIRERVQGDSWLVMTESLDSIPMTTAPFPTNRFSITVFRGITKNQIEMAHVTSRIERHVADSIMDKGVVTDNWFFYTCFSDDRWRELASLPQIKTKDDAQKVISILKGEKVKIWVKAYENNPVKEMYGSGIFAEIINRICIQLQYSPIFASKALQAFEQEKHER